MYIYPHGPAGLDKADTLGEIYVDGILALAGTIVHAQVEALTARKLLCPAPLVQSNTEKA